MQMGSGQHKARVAIPALVVLLAWGCNNPSSISKLTPGVSAPSTLDFGQAYVTDVLVREFVVSSTDSGTFKIVSVLESDDALTVSYDRNKTSLRSNQSLVVRVTWRPTVAGQHAGFLRITTTVPGQPDLVVLTQGFAKALPSCDDGNVCTDDYFDRASEICRTTFNEGPCNDGSACTQNDRCHQGVCRSQSITCNDENPCTFNLCDPARGCFYPEGAIHCDDGDPCTKNVCDKDDGCEYPNADNGTPCGEFSCSEANVCILGTCESFDITGTSDGFPCSDDDDCTEGDSCLAGECESGPAREDPILAKSLPVFGTEGGAATDGLRYVFLGDGTLTVATLTPEGELKPVAQEALTGEAVVLVSAGHFLALTSSSLVRVDASDAAAPVLTERLAAHTDAPAYDSVAVSDSRALIAVQNGALLWGTLRYQTSEGEIEFAGLYFVPADGQPLVRLSSAPDITHVAGGMDGAAWVANDGLYWQRLGAAGQVLESLHAAPPASLVALSVRGRSLALLFSEQVQLKQATPAATNPPATCQGCSTLAPGCGLEPLPAEGLYQLCDSPDACGAGRTCATVSVADCTEPGCTPTDCDVTASVCVSTQAPYLTNVLTLAAPQDALDILRLSDSTLIASPSHGVLRVSDAESTAAVIAEVLGATTLWGDDLGFFLQATRGLVLPRIYSDALGTFARVSGPGHGSIRGAALLGAAGARVAGGAIRATLRLNDPAFLSWNVSTESPNESPAAILVQGDARPSFVPIPAGMSFPTEACASGAALVVRELAAPSVDRTLCGLGEVMPTTFMASRLWGVSDVGDVVYWDLLEADPLMAQTLTPGAPATGLWGAREGTVLAVTHADGAVSFFDADLDVWTNVGAWPADATATPLAFARSELMALANDGVTLQMTDTTSGTAGSSASMTISAEVSDAQAWAMQGGQAWLTAQNASGQDVLMQLHYNTSGGELFSIGQMSWPQISHPTLARVVDAFALGEYVVVVRNSDVGVFEPACQ